MVAILPDVYLAAVAALNSGTWASGFSGDGFAIPGDLYGANIPETATLPYLRLDGETERDSAFIIDKDGNPNEATQSGTAWATSRHLARKIATAAANRLRASTAIAGHRILKTELDLLESLPQNPAEPGVSGAAFRIRLYITPTS
jgi:hypothetical protein